MEGLSIELLLVILAERGEVTVVEKILREKPDVNVNWMLHGNWSALHKACIYGHDNVVALLLAHPKIDVNVKCYYGYTPLLLDCHYREGGN